MECHALWYEECSFQVSKSHDNILNPYFDWLIVYIDDILVFSNSVEQHFKHMITLLRVIKEAGLVLSKKKLEMFQTKIKFLGHIISNGTLVLQQQAVEFANKFPYKILGKTQLQRCLGILKYVIHLYKDCAKDCKVLNERLKKEQYPWSHKHTKAVQKIKARVKNLPILYVADDDLPKIVETNASNIGWGTVLKQVRIKENKRKVEEILQFA